jgi:hypothetical protein
MRPSLLVRALVLLVVARPAIAQSFAPGSPVRVRLAQPSGEMLEGVLGGITDDSVVIQRAERGDVRLARGSVLTLFQGIREHRESSAAISALAGAPLGMLIGALVGSATAKPGAGHRAVGGALGAVAGLLIGATVGGTVGHERPGISWVEIPWPTEPPAPFAAPGMVRRFDRQLEAS